MTRRPTDDEIRQHLASGKSVMVDNLSIGCGTHMVVGEGSHVVTFGDRIIGTPTGYVVRKGGKLETNDVIHIPSMNESSGMTNKNPLSKHAKRKVKKKPKALRGK